MLKKAGISCLSFLRSYKAVERKFLLRAGLYYEEQMGEQNTVFIISNFPRPHCDSPVGLMKRKLMKRNRGPLSVGPSEVLNFKLIHAESPEMNGS